MHSMKIGAKTVIAILFISLLAVSGLLLRHIKPLIPLSFEVFYTETGDFSMDGRIYMPAFRRNLLYLHLPKARSEHRWWVIKPDTMSIYSPRPPTFFMFTYFVFRKDFFGRALDCMSDRSDWKCRFNGDEFSFSGTGITAIVRREK